MGGGWLWIFALLKKMIFFCFCVTNNLEILDDFGTLEMIFYFARLRANPWVVGRC